MSRELDAKVARAQGYYVGPIDWGGCDFLYATDEATYRRYIEDGVTGCDSTSGVGVFCLELPHYSTDIAAAWQVVEWMREKSIGITISTVGPRHQTSAYTTIKGQSLYKCHVWADSAPEAICLAFLRAMGLDGEGEEG